MNERNKDTSEKNKNTYVPTIGLEIHAELKTQTKMFCDSLNNPDETRPNTNVCPVCLAHPGTLPVINREAVRHVLRVGIAVKGTLADYTEFDRKNYFYPDLPKGYQLSQYEYPLVSGGELSRVKLTRIHLEEDTASSLHDEASGATTIDYNRAGVPLMELVTEPVIRSAEEAGAFARELQLLLRYLGVSEANMEKGEMRVEANVSIRTEEQEKKKEFGTKVEIKNLNSFRIMERAVAYEIERQVALLQSGGEVVQETRGWDEKGQGTFAQRTKEGSADYRYFPDPDLPSLKLSEVQEFQPEVLKEDMPELPSERRQRYIDMGIQRETADLFVKDPGLGTYFEAVIEGYPASYPGIVLASNYIGNDLVKIIRDTEKRDTDTTPENIISARKIKEILGLLLDRKISSRTAKDLLMFCIQDASKDPERIAEEKGLFQVRDANSIETVIKDVISQNQAVIADYKAGKEAALEFLVGQGMKALKGAVDPNTLRALIQEEVTSN